MMSVSFWKISENFRIFLVVSLNVKTSLLLKGGFTWPDDLYLTFYYEHYTNQWMKGPELNVPRYSHAAGLLTDTVTQEVFVAVTGGYFDEALVSTEILMDGIWVHGMYFSLYKYWKRNNLCKNNFYFVLIYQDPTYQGHSENILWFHLKVVLRLLGVMMDIRMVNIGTQLFMMISTYLLAQLGLVHCQRWNRSFHYQEVVLWLSLFQIHWLAIASKCNKYNV